MSVNDDALPFGSDRLDSHFDETEHQTSVIVRTDREKQPVPELTEELLSFTRNPGVMELGHYGIRETIGRGGFGVVVKAFDQKLQRIVAIKMMSSEMAATSPARKRFVREARAGAGVRHENVVRIYAVEEHPVPYLVMEYVPGGSLQQYLDKTGPLEVRDVLRIGAQIARGLASAHELGLVHRDIKPANVMLESGEHPQVKLTDFGLARAADDASLSQSGTVVGTPMYMAPEQARGESFDHRADLYSLGSVLYVMVCGRPPFRAANSLAVLMRVSVESPRPIREIIPETPQWLCDIIGKLHARKPEDRFASATEAAEVLEKCYAELQQGRPVVLPALATPGRATRWLRVAAASALGCAAVIAGFAAFRPTAPAGNAADPPPAAKPDRAAADFTNALGIEFVRVRAGKSLLGGTSGNLGKREVEIAYDFYIGKYEVTREEWEKLMGVGTAYSLYSRTGALKAMVADVSDEELKRFPVDGVSWADCQQFIARLNKQVKESGWAYRLPLSTEWEFACRNGPGQSIQELGCDFYAGEPSTTLGANRANFKGTGLNRPCAVGSFAPNRLGIYDMQGNVFELLDDAPGENKECRLLVGGFWNDDPFQVRASLRAWAFPEIRVTGSGLRLVRVPAEYAVTPRQQLETLATEIQRLNPEFTGRLLPTIADDRITELLIADAGKIKDISPLRELRQLKILRIEGGQYADLSPLKGLPLRELSIDNNWSLRDLSPLKGMSLETLRIWGFQGDDLSPLEGMPLRLLNCGSGRKKLDLNVLKGMPLGYLCVNHTEVDDLSALKGMPLETLLMEHTQVTDLSPIKGMKLQVLALRGSPVADLNLLRDMPLQSLTVDFQTERDTELLRAIPTLVNINDKPAAAFWEEFEKK
jgi:formylglycine-generating enzyme required for sulfatase activity